MRVAIVGAGWAGMAAAVSATQAGYRVSVFEASHTPGGRARSFHSKLPDGTPVVLDNGQHILIGAYRTTLRLMQCVGMSPEENLLRVPLRLEFPDGTGLRLPSWIAPLDVIAGIVSARGWTWTDKWTLLQWALRWHRRGYVCPANTTVAQLCEGLTARVRKTLLDLLCVSALNTPPAYACGQVFLRVLHDALMEGTGASDLLLPRADLTRLFPQAAAEWIVAREGSMHLGTAVQSLHYTSPTKLSLMQPQWQVNGLSFDAVVWATGPWLARKFLARCVDATPPEISAAIAHWLQLTQALQAEAIGTVYAYARGVHLKQPMLTLHNDSPDTPAHYVFDRGQLDGPGGLLAFVVSANTMQRQQLQARVLAQAHTQLGLRLEPVGTVIEKQATFACTPSLVRPGTYIAPGLWACGDYIAGPYPATLESAARSGVSVIAALQKS